MLRRLNDISEWIYLRYTAQNHINSKKEHKHIYKPRKDLKAV